MKHRSGKTHVTIRKKVICIIITIIKYIFIIYLRCILYRRESIFYFLFKVMKMLRIAHSRKLVCYRIFGFCNVKIYNMSVIILIGIRYIYNIYGIYFLYGNLVYCGVLIAVIRYVR